MSLGRNILWNLGGFVWLTLLVILVTPYMVRRLGLDAFGVWALITASSGYLAAMDFGLGNALIRFLAAEDEGGKRAGYEAYLRSGATLQAALGAIAGGALFLGAPLLAHRWFGVPADLAGEAETSFRLAALAVFGGFLATTYAAVPASLRRFDILAMRTVILVTLQYVLFVAVLHWGGGLREVVAAYVIGTLVIVGYMIAMARKLLPGLVLVPGWDAAAGREFFRFGRYKFAAQISWTFIREFDRIAIGILLPVARVSYYAVPLRLSQRITQIVEQIATPFYPAVTSQLTGGRHEELRAQYRVGTRLITAVAFGIAGILGGLATPVLGVWLGADFAREGTGVLRILLLAYAASSLFTLPSVAADGGGRPGINASLLAIAAAVHVPLVVFGIRKLDLSGAALGVLAGFAIPLIGVGIIHAKLPALPALGTVIRDGRGALLAGIVTAVAGALVARIPFAGSGIPALLATLAGAGLLYLGLLFLFRGLRIEDVRRLTSALERR
jgi:O-antigen/teichoic acid export membrane protein